MDFRKILNGTSIILIVVFISCNTNKETTPIKIYNACYLYCIEMKIDQPAKKYKDAILKNFKNINEPQNHPEYKNLLYSIIIYPANAKNEFNIIKKILPNARDSISNKDTLLILLGIDAIEKFVNKTDKPIIFAEKRLYSWKIFRDFSKNFINITFSIEIPNSFQNEPVIIIYPPQSKYSAEKIGEEIERLLKVKSKFILDTNFKNIIISFKKNFIPSKEEEYWIRVVKHEFTLYLYKGENLVKSYKIGIGKNPGDKEKVGDMKTPEGDFYITNIHNSRDWTHDFKDGKGPIKGAYGPWFLRLYTGADRTKSGKYWNGIGIHGTHDPNSIGKMVSEGCLRMHNQELEELKRFVKIGTKVIIDP